jgi:tetratricopeptide (TPR) repeat protein
MLWLYEMKDYDKAQVALEKAIEASKARRIPDDRAYLTLAQVLLFGAEHSKNPQTQRDQALALLDKLAPFMDKHPVAQFYRAMALYHSHKMSEAVQAFDAYLDVASELDENFDEALTYRLYAEQAVAPQH